MFGGGGVSGGGGNGLPGAPGKSAYQVALDNGFVGTQSEWLASLDGVDGAPGPQGVPGDVGPIGDPGPKGLDGEDAYHLAFDNGFTGTLTDWLASIKGDKGDKGDVGNTGPDGLSAYQIAVAGGFTGTQDVWLTTLNGTDGAQGPRGFQGPQGDPGSDGAPGESAYAIALDNGFAGTQAQWLLSIHGADGAPGPQGDLGPQGPVGPPGTDGLNGKSAYELAVTGGFSGTQDQWLASLHGSDGIQGPKGDTGAAGNDGADGESAYQLAIGEGFVGTLPAWLASLKGADGSQGPQGDQGPQGFQGPQGTAGINGNSVLNGTTAPAAGVGNDGDFYINKTTNVIYGPRAAGTWPAGGTALVGPQGPQGVQGVQGTAGTNGNTLLNGSGAPDAATGRDGDFYLDTSANTIYGPRAAGAWPAGGTALVGPQGLQGVQGNPGAAGNDGLNGKTAYELAVTQGYSGTLSDWLASLQGAQGPQGPAGVVAAGTHGDVSVAADSTFTVLRAGTLTTARNINGVLFDGSADITINAVDATAREPAIAAGLVAQYWRGDKTWQTLNSAAVGLGNVNNTADSTKIVAKAGVLTTARNINGVLFDGSADITINAVDTTPRIATSLIGAANGIVPLGADTKISAAYLPSYVDDILEFANLAAFPTTGETGKIYVADDTNWEYRWSGSQYIRLVASPGSTDALAEGAVNLYFTTARAIASPLTGLSQVNALSITATDTILSAIGKLGYRAFTYLPANYAQLTGAAFTGGVSVSNNNGFLLYDTLGGQAGLIYDNTNTLRLYASSNTGSAVNILTVNGRVASPTLNVVVPMTGVAATFNGTLTATGATNLNGNVIVGTNTLAAGISIYLNAASGQTRTYGFLTAGAYAADIALQADNGTIKHNSSIAHRFDVSGSQKFIVNSSGITVTGTASGSVFSANGPSGVYQVWPRDGTGGATQLYSPVNNDLRIWVTTDVMQITNALVQAFVPIVGAGFDATYGVAFKQSRNGQVGYHMYNGGSVAEWLLYQPAHTAGDEFRIATFVGGTVTDRFKIGADGTTTVTGSLTVGGNITSSSDERLKTNIRPLASGLELCEALQGVRFEMIAEPEIEQIGLIAQQVEDVIPEVVLTDAHGMKSVDYSRLTAVLIEAVKELSAEVAELKARSAA